MTQENHFISPRLLDRLIATSSAAAAIILRGGKVVMEAGELHIDGFRTAESILQSFDASDVLQKYDHYVGFTMGGQYHLLFAKNFPKDDALLGLVFSIQTPLSQIRQEMQLMMKALIACKALNSDQDLFMEQSLKPVLISTPEPDPTPQTELSQSGWEPEVDRPIEQAEESETSTTQNLSVQDHEQPTVEPEKNTMNFGAAPQSNEDLTPPTDLEVMMDEIPWMAIDEQWMDEPDDNQETSSLEQDSYPAKVDEPAQQFIPNQNWQPLTELPHEGDDLISMLQDDFEMERQISQSEEDYFLPHAFGFVDDEEISAQLHEDTEPISVESDEKTPPELIADTTFYLVPRLNEHYLLRDLSRELRSWMPEICKKYDWQLDSLNIRPDYLKWTLRDFPESQVREMLTIVRLETSRNIIRRFPNLLDDIPTQDFWSPGYLVDTENREFSTRALISQISESRLDG